MEFHCVLGQTALMSIKQCAYGHLYECDNLPFNFYIREEITVEGAYCAIALLHIELELSITSENTALELVCRFFLFLICRKCIWAEQDEVS